MLLWLCLIVRCYVAGMTKKQAAGGQKHGFEPPTIIASHRGGTSYSRQEEVLFKMPSFARQRSGPPEIDEITAPPDFLPGFIFGCVVMAGLTGIIVGLCLRIETLRRCECLVDITSCILAADESKLDPDHTISPLKEPLKKKGNDITNPYPNFKVPEGLPGGLLMVSESPRLNRKNSMRSMSSFRSGFKSWGGLGRKPSHSSRKMIVTRAGSVSGSIAKSTTSNKQRMAWLSGRRSSVTEADARSVHSSRSSGTMRSRDGNWSSQATSQAQSFLSQTKYASPSLSRRGQNETVLNQTIEGPIQVPTFQKQATFNEAIVY